MQACEVVCTLCMLFTLPPLPAAFTRQSSHLTEPFPFHNHTSPPYEAVLCDPPLPGTTSPRPTCAMATPCFTGGSTCYGPKLSHNSCSSNSCWWPKPSVCDFCSFSGGSFVPAPRIAELCCHVRVVTTLVMRLASAGLCRLLLAASDSRAVRQEWHDDWGSGHQRESDPFGLEARNARFRVSENQESKSNAAYTRGIHESLTAYEAVSFKYSSEVKIRVSPKVVERATYRELNFRPPTKPSVHTCDTSSSPSL